MKPLQLRDWVELVQAVLTCLAILAAGLWTYILFIRRRQQYPRARVEHHVMDRPVSRKKRLLRVVVKVSNIGDVLLPLDSVAVRLQQVLPWRADYLGKVENVQAQMEKSTSELHWPVLDERRIKLKTGVQEIEPGEDDEFPYDFIIDEDVKTLSIYSYVKNSYKKRHILNPWRVREEIGWNTTTLYELDQGEPNDAISR